jgi:hypothetical protein
LLLVWSLVVSYSLFSGSVMPEPLMADHVS